MSRVAKRPVDLPQGVTASVAANTIKVKGAKGELSLVVADGVTVEQQDKKLQVSVRERRCAHVRGRRARAPREHGDGRVEGLRAQARAGRRRLPRRGAGQGAEPHARLLARGEFPDPGRHLDGERRARPKSSSRASTARRSARCARRSAASVRRSLTRARACVTRANRSSSRRARRSNSSALICRSPRKSGVSAAPSRPA